MTFPIERGVPRERATTAHYDHDRDYGRDRPENCTCLPRDDLVCWPCYRAGFREANPDGTGRAER